jgi:internalin A
MRAVRILIIVWLIATSAGRYGTALAQTNIVTFADPNLALAVSKSLNGGLVTGSNILSLTVLNAQSLAITNLSGLDSAVNLQHLYLSGNAINNLSPLQKLGGLIDLELDRNAIVDISPLAGLTNLTSIGLGGNAIGNYSTLTNLTSLTRLSLYNSSITTLGFLQNLKNLTALNIYGNRFRDISPLLALTNLNDLDLRWNAVTNHALLSQFQNLTRLALGDNAVSDLSPLQSLTRLNYLNLGQNVITNLTPLTTLTNLEYVVVSGNPGITNYTVLGGLTQLVNLEARGNFISNLEFASGLSNLKFADLAYNNITNLSPLMTLTNLAAVNLTGNQNKNLMFGPDGPPALWLSDQGISNVMFLTNFTRLTALGLENNMIRDPSPLAGLTQLDFLGLSRNPITNYSALTQFTNLTRLWIEGNSCSNLDFIQGLTSLQSLNIRTNRFRDLTALSSLTNLNTIYAANNRLTNITTLADLPNLSRVDITGNLLDLNAGSTASMIIQNLQNRGVQVDYLPTNRPPTVSIASVWYVAANKTSTLNYSTTDALVSPGELTMTANSSSQPLIADSGFTFNGTNGLNGSFTLTPSTNQTGVTTITLTVSQPPGGLSASSNFLVNVMFATNVTFEKNLANVLTNTLGKPATLTSVDLMYLKSLSANSKSISSLSGLEFAANLTNLHADVNSIRNLTPLQNLAGLVELSLNNNLITNVSPLAGLTQLVYLDLSWNPFTNFTALSGLTNLTTLLLAGNAPTNLSFLAGLTRLTNLDISSSQIIDLTLLAGLTNLTTLSLQQNRITNITALAGLKKLANVNLSLNLLSTSAIKLLTTNGVSVVSSPQRKAPVITVKTNWTFLASSSKTNFVVSITVSDTGPANELLGVGAAASSASLAYRLALGSGPVTNQTWSLTISNYVATNTVLVTLGATNDVGLSASAKVTLGPVVWLDIVGPVTNARCNLRLSVIPGQPCIIQTSTKLPNNWSYLALMIPTNSPVYFTDTNAFPGSRFYRLAAVPAIRLDILGPVTNARCNLRLTVIPGQPYEIQTSTDLFSGWSTLASIVPTNSPFDFTDTTASPVSRYYRLKGL